MDKVEVKRMEKKEKEEKRMEKRFSDEWLIRHGFTIGAGDGYFVHDGYAIVDEDEGEVVIPGTYYFRGWELSGCKLWVAIPGLKANGKFAEDIYNPFGEGPDYDWGVRPTDSTRVLTKGEPGALRRTVFEGFEK